MTTKAWRDSNKEKYNAYQREFYAKNKTTQQEKIYANRNKRKQELKDTINEIKNTPCKDCGVIYHPEAMDFDHIVNKRFNISDAIKDVTTIDKILKEVEKCEIVCSNCHRIRTAKRAGRI